MPRRRKDVEPPEDAELGADDDPYYPSRLSAHPALSAFGVVLVVGAALVFGLPALMGTSGGGGAPAATTVPAATTTAAATTTTPAATTTVWVATDLQACAGWGAVWPIVDRATLEDDIRPLVRLVTRGGPGEVWYSLTSWAYGRLDSNRPIALSDDVVSFANDLTAATASGFGAAPALRGDAEMLNADCSQAGSTPATTVPATTSALQASAPPVSVPSFIVTPGNEAGGPSVAGHNPPDMGNCSPGSLSQAATDQGFTAITFTESACAWGWAVGLGAAGAATEVGIFKWVSASGWAGEALYGEAQAQTESASVGMPPGLAYDLELQAKGCPSTDPYC